ncbi:MAG: gamma-glutamyl-gamma-aminobutyrate hydrolase family protein [Sporichthyaceae bacterium]|nr:gamma-glutamyl-gamma-aminobutyrate hydrolase family protein [Sporichthyaceae bacterium]
MINRARPLVGITCLSEEISWGVWQVPGTFVPTRYTQSIDLAGGYPVLLPPLGSVTVGAAALCDRLDALVLAGGADIDPARYGAVAHPATGPLRPDRDRAELALLDVALSTELPVLAICRGMQVLNVACGGTLIQHLPDATGSRVHLAEPGRLGQHRVRIADGSLLAKLLDGVLGVDDGWIEAASHHHQAVDRPGAGLMVTGWAEDGIIEAIEVADHRFALGVQWHPEMVGTPTDQALFAGLLAAV